MTNFAWFDEAARLYAENFDVVKEMERAYREGASRLLTALEKAIEQRLEPLPFQTYSTPMYRYWLAGTGGYTERPYLWFGHSDPSYIDHQSIVLLAYAPASASIQQIEALRAIQLEPELGQVARRGKFDLYGIEVPFKGDDPLQPAAEQIASVLSQLAHAYDSAAGR